MAWVFYGLVKAAIPASYLVDEVVSLYKWTGKSAVRADESNLKWQNLLN